MGAIPGIDSPTIAAPFGIAQNGSFRESDFLSLTTTGTVTLPNPNGSFSTTVGPAAADVSITSSSFSQTIGAVTITATTATQAAQTYYVFFTYIGAASIEGLPGPEFIINCAANLKPIVNVASTGSPTNSTQFATYVGTYPGGECQQNAGTNFGSPYTFGVPLSNNIGVTRASTNPASNIVGLSMQDSGALWATGVGGSFTAGGPGNVLGTWANPAPLGVGDAIRPLIIRPQNNQIFEMSLKQAFYPSLIGTTAGIALDTATGWWIVDTGGGNKIVTIAGAPTGAEYEVGGVTDIGSRVNVFFNSGTV